MKAFKFQFDTIKRFRESLRDEAKRRVTEAEAALRILQDQLDSMDADFNQLKAERAKRLVGSISINGLLDHGRYDLQIETNRRNLVGQMQQVAEEIERRRQRLSLAEQEYRKFEKLEESARERHTLLVAKTEQEALDETASQRHRRFQPTKFDAHE